MPQGNAKARPEDDAIDRRRLGTYLNDHLMGATAGGRVARRSAEANAGTEYGRVLSWLADEIDEERETLRRVMAALNLPENPFKKLTGVLLERAGSLKLNGQIVGYSPLSRLLELEGLVIGVLGKRCLWQTLEVRATKEPARGAFDLPHRQARAGGQLSRVGQLRLDARLPAFESTPAPSRASERTSTGARSSATKDTSHTTGQPLPPLRPTFDLSRASKRDGGAERRTGEERRQRMIFTSAAADRRSGTDRRSSSP